MPAIEGRLPLPASFHFCPKPSPGPCVSKVSRLSGRRGLFGEAIVMVFAET